MPVTAAVFITTSIPSFSEWVSTSESNSQQRRMSMKKFLSVFFVFMLVSYLCTVALAQVKGISHAQGHAPDVSRDHGQNHDKNIAHDSNHAGTDATKLEARIERNPGLKSKIESLLPPNTDYKTALSGFKNEGQ